MKHVHWFGVAVCLSLAVMTGACGSDSDNKSSSGGANTGGDGGGTGGGGSCTGALTSCSLGSYSDAQQAEFCDLVISAIDAAPGTTYECKSGPQEGLSITIHSKDDCVKGRSPSSCTVKGSEVIDCYKAAKADPCAAMAADGACGKVFAKARECSTG